MKLGIVGLPNVGKSTLFNSLTKAGAESANYPFCTIDPNVGIVSVPDSRLDALAEEIHKAGVALLEHKALYKSNRLETQRKAREMKERQVLLEAEIDALYPIPKKVKMESRSEI